MKEKEILEGNKLIHGDYLIFKDGRIQNKKGLFLKLHKGAAGYINFNAFCKYHIRCFLVHRLVAMAYIPNPNNHPEVNHKDGNKLNNHVDNLEWVSRSENILHGIKIGLIKKSMVGRVGKKHWRSKEVICKQNGVVVNTFESTGDAARKTGLHRISIQDACTGKLKTYKGCIWKYKE